MLACISNQLLDLGDNGGPTFEAHSNAPLRGGKLNFFEGGIRPACFVHSPLLKIRASGGEGVVYTGILHTTDWFATFAALSGASLPSPDDPSLAINGIDAWPVFTAVARDGNRTMDSNDRFVDAGARQEARLPTTFCEQAIGSLSRAVIGKDGQMGSAEIVCSAPVVAG